MLNAQLKEKSLSFRTGLLFVFHLSTGDREPSFVTLQNMDNNSDKVFTSYSGVSHSP